MTEKNLKQISKWALENEEMIKSEYKRHCENNFEDLTMSMSAFVVYMHFRRK